MRTLIITAMLVAGVGSAMAEEVIRREGPAVVPPAREGVVVKDRDCASKTVHKSDGAGDSTTVKKTSCD